MKRQRFIRSIDSRYCVPEDFEILACLGMMEMNSDEGDYRLYICLGYEVSL